MKNQEIFTIEALLKECRKEIKTNVVSLDLARDNRTISAEAEIIRDELDRLKPERLIELESAFQNLFSEIAQIEQARLDKEFENTTEAERPRINFQFVELTTRAKFPEFDELKTLQTKYNTVCKQLLKNESSVKLITKIKPEDLPDEMSPQLADLAMYFMD